MITVVNVRKSPKNIYCGRGSVLGNPYVMSDESKRDQVCDQYQAWLTEQIILGNQAVQSELDFIVAQAQQGDISLGCYCAPKRCHCDTIKQYVEDNM